MLKCITKFKRAPPSTRFKFSSEIGRGQSLFTHVAILGVSQYFRNRANLMHEKNCNLPNNKVPKHYLVLNHPTQNKLILQLTYSFFNFILIYCTMLRTLIINQPTPVDRKILSTCNKENGALSSFMTNTDGFDTHVFFFLHNLYIPILLI